MTLGLLVVYNIIIIIIIITLLKCQGLLALSH